LTQSSTYKIARGGGRETHRWLCWKTGSFLSVVGREGRGAAGWDQGEIWRKGGGVAGRGVGGAPTKRVKGYLLLRPFHRKGTDRQPFYSGTGGRKIKTNGSIKKGGFTRRRNRVGGGGATQTGQGQSSVVAVIQWGGGGGIHCTQKKRREEKKPRNLSEEQKEGKTSN